MVGEFDWIGQYFRPLAAGNGIALDLVDDAALIPLGDGQALAVTTDAIVAGRHFLHTDPLDLVARKLMRVNLSDLAAMGAEPVAVFLTLAWPDRTSDADVAAFSAGLGRDLTAFRVALGGGDTVATDGPLTASLTAIGRVEEEGALRRSGAKVGDVLWVSGTIGDGALGLRAAQGGLTEVSGTHREALAGRYHLPEPRLCLGRALRGRATAALDVSDGLLQDVHHIATASGIGIVVEAERIPLSAAGRAVVDSGAVSLLEALCGGDDYELAFTAPAGADGEILARASASGIPVTKIGRAVAAEPAGQPVKLVDARGRTIPVPRPGYSHF